MKMLLFDIDGTLLHTGGIGQSAFEVAFEELFGVPDCWADLIPDGKTDPVIIEEIADRALNRKLSSFEYNKLCSRYHFHFRKQIKKAPRFRLMPGVIELIPLLSKREDCVLGIATGNFREAAIAKLQRGGLKDFFLFGGYACDSGNRTELTRKGIERGEAHLGRKIPADEIILIGDTPLDVRVGKNLGVKTVAVATGRTSVIDFAAYQPDLILQDLSRPQDFIRLLDLK